MNRKTTRQITAFLSVLTSVLCVGSGSAYAWDFDEESGALTLTGDVQWSADDATLPEGVLFNVYDGNFEPKELVPEDFVESDHALEGRGVYRFGGETSFAVFDFGGIQDRFKGRRTEVRLWARAIGTTLTSRLYWYANGAETNASREDLEQRNYMGTINLQPTGRVTSDGWQEWTTGPFDWDAVGNAPLGMTLQDAQLSGQGYLQADSRNRVEVDAWEIEDVGPAAVEAAQCDSTSSADTCGDVGVCMWGRCVDAVVMSAPLPSEGLRADYLERRIHQYEVFAGSYYAQSRMQELRAALTGLVDETSPVRFWDTMRVQIAALRDGHANAPYEEYSTIGNTGICLLMSDADLLPGRGNLPMIADLRGWDERLQVGDVLVSVDGLDPYEWLNNAPLAPRFFGDPVVGDFISTSDIVRHAVRTGATLVFERCALEEGAACTEDDVEEIVVDLAAELGENPFADGMPEWVQRNAPCDYRFRRWLDDPQVTRYSFAGGTIQDDIGYLLINGTPFPSGSWRDAVAGTLDQEPSVGWILDERTGGGGVVNGVTFMTGYFLDPDTTTVEVRWYPHFEEGLSEDLFASTETCLDNPSFLPTCGGSFRWDLWDGTRNRGLHKDKPLAILIGLDVSGNDYLTQLLKMRDTPTRIFGSPATWGAFGTLTSFPTHLSEVYGGAAQISDTLFFEGPHEAGQPFPEWTTGVGVPADEIIYQRQSDALRGEDTILKRAQEWLEEVAEQ